MLESISGCSDLLSFPAGQLQIRKLGFNDPKSTRQTGPREYVSHIFGILSMYGLCCLEGLVQEFT